ncbi:MAG: phage tail sheath C-terminal domain-containing protein, partial [Paraclostridium sp.]|uniref:phage tail sheath C-terminal domain-containing protein n=1 Tax=Paraclostridium sp. TaxID=2023273 RepID=UPI003F2C5234
SLAFLGNPFKVILYRVKIDLSNLQEVLKTVEKDEPNYFSIPIIPVVGKAKSGSTLKTDVESWLNNLRNEEGIKLGKEVSTIKLVTSCDVEPNKPYIIDYSSKQTHHVVAGLENKVLTAQEYSLCVASLCAGVPLNASITNMNQPWLKSFKSSVANEDEEIAKGKVLTGYDGEKYTILRGVTSFIEATDDKNVSFTKIRKMEIMDIHQKDIRNTFKSSYRGRYQNTYDNKRLLLGAINSYLSTFKKNGQLNPSYDNKMVIDLEAHRKFLLDKGTYKGKQITEEDIKKMSDYELARIDTDDKVFAYIPQYKPTDVMEDFYGEAIM